jgi:leader peptidase (prepilin peptidase) / N-methyltransferase
LPDAIVLPSYPVVGGLLAVAAGVEGDWWALLRAALAAVGLFGFYFLLAVLYPRGMGFGDVKLAGVIGLILGYLSWSAVLVGAFLGFVLGAVVGVVVISMGRGSRKTALPFGPFMIVGALAAVFFAHPLAQVYLDAVRR